MNILVVDDEKEIADVVELYLQNEYHVLKFYTGQEALECIEKTKVDLAILDVMLPDIDGFTILRKIREKYTFPVIMLTAKTEYRDKITGLTMGADDYIPKPFNPLELVARVKAQMRRYTQYNDGKKSDSENIIDFAGLLLNKESHECIYNEQSLPLTPTEFEILWILCENRGKVISSQRLFEEVWHEEYLKNSNNTVMVHIRHLRDKLSKPTGKSDLIKTVWEWDTKLKNNYRKLKLSILLQTVFITALTVLVGRFILEYFIDGIYNDSFANGFLRILEAFHVSEETATSLYWQWIGNNKVFFMILGFLLLFSLFFYMALSK